MHYYDTYFTKGYMTGFLVSSLKATIDSVKENPEIKKIQEKIFPGLTDEISLELLKIFEEKDKHKRDNKMDNFYDKYEEMFKNCLLYEEAQEGAQKALERRNRKESAQRIIQELKEASTETKSYNQGTKNITLLYTCRKDPIVYLETTEERIEFAKNALQKKELTLKEIEENIINFKNNETLIMRYQSTIIYYKECNWYSIYYLPCIDTNKPWYISDCGNYESIKYPACDKYNRINL